MKETTIGTIELREILKFVSEVLTKEESHLNALDAAIGDGDHGTTVRLGFQAVREAVENTPSSADISDILGDAGTAFMDATGGAIGIILGQMFLCGRKALKGRVVLGAVELKCWLDAMEFTIAAVGNAKPGDKTILDAVHAAGIAVSASSPQDDVVGVFFIASRAADRAARDTATMLCKIGRASRLGERALGHPDPGAITFSIIIDSFYRWLIEDANSSKGPQPRRLQI